MSSPLTDFTGKTVGLLTGIEPVKTPKGTKWKCRCVCGKIVVVWRSTLLQKACTDGCGCAKKQRDPNRYGLTYVSWQAMLLRCSRPKNINYADYGGRGITVCDAWRSYDQFLADMGERPSRDHSIERKDTNGNYEPDNCVWATRREQSRNKRTSRLLTFNGRTLCVSEWAEETGISSNHLFHRLRAGRPVEQALTQPIKRHASNRKSSGTTKQKGSPSDSQGSTQIHSS